MQKLFLFIWFWLMIGCTTFISTILASLYEKDVWYKKVLFWPYYILDYMIKTIKIKRNETKR